jgi:hypothetical protein
MGMAKSQAAFVAALLLAVVIAGGKPAPIGIHADCLDDVDNDLDLDLNGDGFLDLGELSGDPRAGIDINGAFQMPPGYDTDRVDMDCVEYPWADGNGESFTPPELRFTNERGYESSTFDAFMSGYDPLGIDGDTNQDPCDPLIQWPAEDGSADQASSYCAPP